MMEVSGSEVSLQEGIQGMSDAGVEWDDRAFDAIFSDDAPSDKPDTDTVSDTPGGNRARDTVFSSDREPSRKDADDEAWGDYVFDRIFTDTDGMAETDAASADVSDGRALPQEGELADEEWGDYVFDRIFVSETGDVPHAEMTDSESGSLKQAQDSGDAQDGAADAKDTDAADASDADEQKELTQEEINEKQRKAIKEGIIKLLKGELNKDEKGNLAEMIMDQYYVSKGYTPLHERVTSLDQKGHKGIDGVYEKEGPDGKKHYVIADAKYGQSPLGDTKDGTKQMSDDWVDDRLDDAVGEEKADEIRAANQEGNVDKTIFHVDVSADHDGIVCETQSVNVNGSKEPGTKQEVQTYDVDGNVKEAQA